MAKPVVAIVGRPNVGKSTLFNRLTGGRTAIVADVAGVTRDRLYRDVEWNRTTFSLIDTGGLFPEEEEFAAHIHEQVDKAMGEADLVLFVVDGRVGPTERGSGDCTTATKSQAENDHCRQHGGQFQG